MYEGLMHDMCQTAWDITSQSVIWAGRNGVTNKVAGSIVVCFPRDGSEFDADSIAFKANVVSGHPSEKKYERFALEKARVSWETGLPSRTVQQDAPFLYRPGMVKWGGSVIEHGLVVAFSGVQEVFDVAIAGTMLRWVVALCQDEMLRSGGVMGVDTSFIGGIYRSDVLDPNFIYLDE